MRLNRRHFCPFFFLVNRQPKHAQTEVSMHFCTNNDLFNYQ